MWSDVRALTPDGLRLQTGDTDWVESRKLRDAQNCPDRALVSRRHDLSTAAVALNVSSLSPFLPCSNSLSFNLKGLKRAATIDPTGADFGEYPQNLGRHTPRDNEMSSSRTQ